jgi:hypothetical protein
MFGKPEWFTYRFAGWGIGAKTWQGWVYIAAWAILFSATAALPLPGPARNALLGTLSGVALLDVVIIWSRLGEVHDERQRLHQLVIERNCSISAVVSLVGAMAWQTLLPGGTPRWGLPFDPVLLVVLCIMALTKLLSTLYVRKRL